MNLEMAFTDQYVNLEMALLDQYLNLEMAFTDHLLRTRHYGHRNGHHRLISVAQVQKQLLEPDMEQSDLVQNWDRNYQG